MDITGTNNMEFQTPTHTIIASLTVGNSPSRDITTFFCLGETLNYTSRLPNGEELTLSITVQTKTKYEKSLKKHKQVNL